jgi:deoxycytidine triphosphate deaminase
MEISNNSPWPVKIYANKGIAQVHFLKGEVPLRTYQGHYQNQEGLTLAKGL